MHNKICQKILAFSGVLLLVVFLSTLISHSSSSVLFTRSSDRQKGLFMKYFVDVGRKQTNSVPSLRYGFEWLDANATISFDTTISFDLELKDPQSAQLLELLYFTQSKRLQITCPQPELMGDSELLSGWDVCVAEPYKLKSPCLVYSIGMAAPEYWSFDRTVTKKYGCKDFAYDPTIGMKTHKVDDLLWFFAVGLSGKDSMWRNLPMKTLPTILKENNHTETTIDILKIDIECSEWTSFDAILASPGCLSNIKQLMVEFHPCRFTKFRKGNTVPQELLRCWRTLRGIDKLGFKLWKVWNNPSCYFSSRRLHGVAFHGCHNAYYLNVKYLL